MSEITRITIGNFQSHKHTVIEPAPEGLTVLVGASDSGKTAILRALKWLFYNQPNGTEYIRGGESTARVRVEFADGRWVERRRSRKGGNLYEIRAVDDEIRRFEGFGSGVPLEVQEITGVKLVRIGDLEMQINLAEQLDGPFLGKAVSSLVKAKVLGKLAGTEEIDYAGKGCGTDIFRGRQEKQRLATEMDKLQTDLVKYDYLPGLAETISQASSMLDRVKANKVRLETLIGLRDRLVNGREKQWLQLSLINVLDDVIKQAMPQLTALIARVERQKRLIDCRDRLEDVQGGIARSEKVLANTSWVMSAEVARLPKLEAEAARLASLKRLKERYDWVEQGIQDAEVALHQTEGIDQAGEAWNQLNVYAEWLHALKRLKERYDWVEQGIQDADAALHQTKDVDQANGVWNRVAQECCNRDALIGCRDRLAQVGILRQHVNETLKKTAGIGEAGQVLDRAVDAEKKLWNLLDIENRLIFYQDEIPAWNIQLKRLAGIGEAEQVLGNLDGLCSRRMALRASGNVLKGTRTYISSAGESIVTAEADLEKAQDAYQNVLLAAGVCPVCGSNVSKNKLKEVV